MFFSYEVTEPEDGEWGVMDKNGNWTGLIGQLVNKVTTQYSYLIPVFRSWDVCNLGSKFLVRKPSMYSHLETWLSKSFKCDNKILGCHNRFGWSHYRQGVSRVGTVRDCWTDCSMI